MSFLSSVFIFKGEVKKVPCVSPRLKLPLLTGLSIPSKFMNNYI